MLAARWSHCLVSCSFFGFMSCALDLLGISGELIGSGIMVAAGDLLFHVLLL